VLLLPAHEVFLVLLSDFIDIFCRARFDEWIDAEAVRRDCRVLLAPRSVLEIQPSYWEDVAKVLATVGGI
jgi:hypothetical protein